MNYTSYFTCSDKSVLHMERFSAFTLLKSVDCHFTNIYNSTRKETAHSGAGTTGFIQPVGLL